MLQFLNVQSFLDLEYLSRIFLFVLCFLCFLIRVVSQLSWPIICLVPVIFVVDITSLNFLPFSTGIYFDFFACLFCSSLIFSPYFYA